ncbi:MAG TPA: hypothetical protein VKE41_25035 [Roseiflexaceae bacterium]|nr:hypothetical protein [Roseiflexaceae bacterium]
MAMRRSLLACGLALLLFSLGLSFVRNEAGDSQIPPNATGIRIDRHGLSEVHINYRIPAKWTLSDVYTYQISRGWVRDSLTERSLQRPWTDPPSTVFAVFTRQRLFGLVSETAIVGVPVDTRAGVNVRQVRCLKIEPWIGCL